MVELENYEDDWTSSEWNLANFEKVVLTYQSRIYKFLFSISRQKPLAEDLTQETFFLAYRNLRSKTAGQSLDYNFSAWLYTIARNAAISDKRRHKNIYPFSHWETNENSNDNFEMLAYEMIKAPARDIDRHLDIQAELEKAIQKVGRPGLLPLLLHLDGFSYKEICEITHTSLPT